MLYLKAKKIDIEAGEDLVVLLNNEEAEERGIFEGQKVVFYYNDIVLNVKVNQTDTKVERGEIGLYSEIWNKYTIPNSEMVSIDILDRPDSIDYIREKLLGSKLTKEEIFEITKDVSTRRIRDVEVAYFMSCFFSPGFDDEEVVNIAKGMAAAGDTLNFHDDEKNGRLIVDKHSIGGIAGKGVTPILVPIIAATGLLIPNTSTRAITSPAGTSDILETTMPIKFTNKEVLEIVKEINGCMIWGGALKLAPADDVMISVERSLHAQSFNKLIASIVAKKIAMSIEKILIDIPYGKSAKVRDADEAEMLGNKFKMVFDKVGIDCYPHVRFVKGPDSYGIGPNLEMKDVLNVLERKDDRPLFLEESALKMAGRLLEISGKASQGKGYDTALGILDDKKALDKFWEIAKKQGAKERITADDINGGEYEKVVKAEKAGVIHYIDNKKIVRVARALGTPFVKEAGIYFHKNVNDTVKEGDELLTLYSVSKDRLNDGLEELDINELIELKKV